MIEKMKSIPGLALYMAKSTPRQDARSILRSLCRSMGKETRSSLLTLKKRSADLFPVHEMHLAIDNLTNVDAAMRRYYHSQDTIGAESALMVLDEQFDQTAKLLTSGTISGSMDAGEIAVRTLNMLFAAKQKLKQEFGIITSLDINGNANHIDISKPIRRQKAESVAYPTFPTVPEIVLPAAMLFELRQSLFPAERMIVGAARKTGGDISIEALFDVTGQASASGVRADPDLLGQALIAMAQTESYFGLWVHSHPGTGAGATHPSGIDLNQHADWLKDYSADLVSAIIVRDRYIRFWGTAVESGEVAIRIEGAGVECVSPDANIYRFGS